MGYDIEKGNTLVIQSSNAEEALQKLVDITNNIQEQIIGHPEYSVKEEVLQLVFDINGERFEEYKFFYNLPKQKKLINLSEQFIKQLIQYNKDYQPVYTHAELETGTFAIEYLVNANITKLPLYIEFLRSIDLDHTVEQLALCDRLIETFKEEQLKPLIDFLREYGGELFEHILIESGEQSPLHEAVKFGNIEKVKKLLKGKIINLEELDSMNGYAALHYSHGSIEMAKLLIESGANVNCQDSNGNSILHNCLIDNGYYNPAFIKYIVDIGDIKLKNKEGRSAVHQVRTVEGLNLILKKGGNLNDQDNDGNTLLHILAPKYPPELLKEVLKNGADPNILNKYGRTPLWFAVQSPESVTSKILYEFGGDIKLKNKKGRSAVHQVRTVEGLNLILKKGGNLNDQDNDGNTLLHILAPFGYEPELFKEILKNGADPNILNKYGRNPLYGAVQSSKSVTAKILYEGGANCDLKDNNGKSPRDISRWIIFK